MSPVAKLELGGEAVDVEGGVDEGHGDVEQPDQLEERLPEREDIRLQQVREVDEQMRRLLAPADDVEAGGADVLGLAPLHEVVLDGEREEPHREVLVVLVQVQN